MKICITISKKDAEHLQKDDFIDELLVEDVWEKVARKVKKVKL